MRYPSDSKARYTGTNLLGLTCKVRDVGVREVLCSQMSAGMLAYKVQRNPTWKTGAEAKQKSIDFEHSPKPKFFQVRKGEDARWVETRKR